MASQIVPVHLKPGKEKMPRLFHPWIFSGAIIDGDRKILQNLSGKVNSQVLARVNDSRGNFLAWGIINPRSQILIRLVDWYESLPDLTKLFTQLFLQAFRFRINLGLVDSPQTSGCRLVFSESDGIPGIIVDKIGNYIIVQIEVAGMESFRSLILECLISAVKTTMPGVLGIWEQSDGDGRSLEGLPKHEELVWGEEPGEEISFYENSLTFLAHPRGQKTGFYFDQRENRKLFSQYVKGISVTDVCSYSGGFSIYAGIAGAKSLHMVDNSASALSLARANLQLNGLSAQFTQADAFEFLRSLPSSSQEALVFDPPKLVPSRKTLDRGLRAYKDGNLHSIRALVPGGILATFSCSGLVSQETFEEVFSYAAKDSGKRVQILHRLHQAPCHPVLTSFPEGRYLKGIIARIL